MLLGRIGTDLLNLKVLRSQILDNLLVGLDGLRDRRPEPVEYTLDRELLHRVCQMGSTTRGGSHVQPRRSCVRPSVRPPVCFYAKSRPGFERFRLSRFWLELRLIRGNPMTCSLFLPPFPFFPRCCRSSLNAVNAARCCRGETLYILTVRGHSGRVSGASAVPQTLRRVPVPAESATESSGCKLELCTGRSSALAPTLLRRTRTRARPRRGENCFRS